MARKKNDRYTRERDEALLKAYEEVLKKHGEYAALMPRTTLYAEVVEMTAPGFFISPKHASQIINRKIREKGGSND